MPLSRQITTEFQIVCEGKSDERFLRKLLKSSGLKQFHTMTPQKENGQGVGRSGLARHLSVIESGIVSSSAKLKGLVIVFDSEKDPQQSFEEICTHLKAQDFPVPSSFSDVAHKTGKPSTHILLIPGYDRPGNLETLILDAMSSLFCSEIACVQKYSECTGSSDWNNIGKLHKMKLTSLLSVIQSNPDRTLKYWLQGSNCPLDFKAKLFTPIVKSLKFFLSEVA